MRFEIAPPCYTLKETAVVFPHCAQAPNGTTCGCVHVT